MDIKEYDIKEYDIKEYDINSIFKPTIISIIGDCVHANTYIIGNILNSWYSNGLNSTEKLTPNLNLKLFSKQLNLITYLFEHNYNFSLYNKKSSIKDYYQYKDYQLINNDEIDHDILIIDNNFIFSDDSSNYNYFYNLLENHTEYKLTIIINSNIINKNIIEYAEYFIINSPNNKCKHNIYTNFYSQNYKIDKFNELFNGLIENNDLLIYHNKFNGVIHKTSQLQDKKPLDKKPLDIKPLDIKPQENIATYQNINICLTEDIIYY
jgi:hypothetical protein